MKLLNSNFIKIQTLSSIYKINYVTLTSIKNKDHKKWKHIKRSFIYRILKELSIIQFEPQKITNKVISEYTNFSSANISYLKTNGNIWYQIYLESYLLFLAEKKGIDIS